jgi:hypothetical protein
MQKQIFKILDNGNFYFPHLYKGQKFEVINTIDFKIENKKFDFFYESLKGGIIDLGFLSRIIYEKVKKYTKNNRKYKNCWFVPLRICDLGKDKIVTIDILKKVK